MFYLASTHSIFFIYLKSKDSSSILYFEQASLDLGTDKFGYGFGGTGKKSNAKQFEDYGEAFGMHDVIGCFLDLVKGEIKFTKNGMDLGVAFMLNAQQKSQTYYPAVVLKNAEMSFNFGAQPFKHPPPNDYVAMSSIPKESVKHNPVNSSQTQAGDRDKPKSNAPQAIIIEPSRELAEQTYNQIQKVRKNLGKRVVGVVNDMLTGLS